MNWFADLADDCLGLLFPRVCYSCGTNLVRNENLICTECFVAIPRTAYHLVKDNPVEQLFWGRCRIERGAAFSWYTRGSRIQKLIHNLKYQGISELGPELGFIYGSTLRGTEFAETIDLLLPVPLHKARLKTRGFNQSELICRGLAEALSLPVVVSALERVAVTSTQTRRSRYDRWTNVEGIFRTADRAALEGRHILLVDDVITTGSTMESCINEILTTNNTRVSVAALACAMM